MTLLGVSLGLLAGCGVLGLFGLGFVTYFAAWCADLFDHLGQTAGRTAMLLGLILGLGLYGLAWAVCGALVVRLLSLIGGRKRQEHGAA